MMKLRIAGILGALAVAAGASGAHGRWADHLVSMERSDEWQTAVLYHLLHGVVLAALALHERATKALTGALNLGFRLLLAGVVFFSGSLYVLAGTNTKWLGAITPIGGLCLIAGWICLACASRR
jgi:uncharacterized membrane protein YgdD (TMEM256/DUF423 family)